jgi:hypothetical protein
VIVGNTKAVDTCVEEGKPALIEYYCENSTIQQEKFDCPYKCSNGACVEAPPQPPVGACNESLVLTCATYAFPDAPFGCKTTGRITITDMAVWNNNLFFGTNDHGSCDNVGEVYFLMLNPSKFGVIGGYDYFNQQGVRHVRYGKDNILVPGLDPQDENNYEIFVFNGSWRRYPVLSDTSGHLVDAVYFNGEYYALTARGNVVVTGNTPRRLIFEAVSYEEKIALGPAQPTSLTVWKNTLYLTGAKRSGCDPKSDPTCKLEYFIWRYNGVGNVKDYYMTPYSLDLGISQDFNGKLYVVGADDLYATEDMMSFNSANLLKSLAPVENNSRVITDLAVVGDKLYAAVLVQTTGSGTVKCNDGAKVMMSVIVKAYEIYSTKDGINWKREFYKEVFLKNYPDIGFQLVNYQNQLYVGMTDGMSAKGFLFQYGNIYKATPVCV